jgi:2-polyprenyl-3-methyl-5-hydroxy-6-metoxy-1,4-benzoquinol methylase
MTVETSSNQRKYESGNPFKRMALDRFYHALLSMPFQPEKALDAGCGEGFGANRLLEKYPSLNISGVDISRQALLTAREIAGLIETAQTDVTRLPFTRNQFDIVLSLEVLEHLPDPAEAVRDYQRVSKRYLLLSVPNEPVFRTLRMLEGNDLLKWGDHPEHIQHWNFITFTRFLKKQGLRVISRKVPFPYTWVIVLCEVVPQDESSAEE